MNHKKHLFTIFLAVFINIAGFALILPLSPALLSFYLPHQEADGGMLGQFISTARTFAESLGKENPTFTTAVFFGCFIASVYSLLQFLFSPICGRLSDRFGRRPVLVITLAGTTLSYALWAIAGSFNLFLIARMLGGVMAASLSVATAAMADITTKIDRTKGMALVGIAFGLGFLFGPAIGGLLTKINLLNFYPNLKSIGINPFSACALVAMLLAAFNLIWILTQFKETLPKDKRIKIKAKCRFLTAFRAQTTAILKTNLSYFIFILAFSGLEFTLSFLATERFSYTSIQIGYLFLYIGFILIFTRGYIIKKISGKVDERAIAAIGVISGIIAFLIIALAFTQILFFIGSSFLALAVALTSTSLTSLVSLYATENTQGQEIGLFNSAGSLARAFGPLLAAIPYIYLGAKGAYVSVSSLLIIPLIIFFFLPKPCKVCLPKMEVETLKETGTPTL